MNKYFCILLAVLAFQVLSSLQFKPEKDTLFSCNSSIQNDSLLCDSLIEFAKTYLHRPYCYGSKVPKCFDCSGFVKFVFSKFGKELPSSSGTIALYGKFISFKNAKAGDLVFFNGRQSQSETVGHVGIVTHSANDSIFFIHASVQAGVIISNTKQKYYEDRLLFIKRNQL